MERKKLLFLLFFYLQSTIDFVKGQKCTKFDMCIPGNKLPVYYRSDPKPTNNMTRYDFTRLYDTTIENEFHGSILREIERVSNSIIFPNYPHYVTQKLSILVPANKISQFEDTMSFYNASYRVVCYNYQTLIEQSYRDVKDVKTHPMYFDWIHYYHLETIYNWMDLVVRTHYKIAKIVDIGKTSENTQIRGLRLDYLNLDEDKDNRTTVFIESGIHAREWATPATATHIAYQLITSADPEIRALAVKFKWLIFPVLNPDGYKYSFTTDRLWKKNRRVYGCCRGVDLNRNFPYDWNLIYNYRNSCSADFGGPYGGSEKETVCLMSYLREYQERDRIRTYFALHSYSKFITFPLSSKEDNIQDFRTINRIGRMAGDRASMNTKMKYRVGSVYGTAIPQSGTTIDWAHKDLGIPVTYNIELRGSPGCRDSYLMPARHVPKAADDALTIIAEVLKQAEIVGYYKPSWNKDLHL